jgi:hypothetical protein
MHTGFWWGNPEEKRLENLDVGGGIVLKWILEKYDGVLWAGFIWLRIGTCAGLLRSC